LAQKALNDSGGINGKKIVLDIQDDAGDPAQAVALAKRFASDPAVVAILGPTRTGATVAVAKILPELKIPMMSVGATGDWQSAAGDFNPWTFRSTRVDTYLVGPLLTFAKDSLHVKKLAIIYTTDDDWSVSVLKVYKHIADSLGLTIVATEGQRTGDTDRNAQLTKIKAAAPDALIINTLATDAPTIAAQARRLGISAKLLGTAGFTNPQTWNLAGPGTLDGTTVADNYFAASDRRVVKDFISSYRSQFNAAAPPYAAYAYDGLMLVAEACRKAKACDNRGELRQQLGSIKNFDGVLGSLSYNGSGDAMKRPVILQIAGDNFRLVQQ
jgi:branched-chain amino acid transport system substrate-binding protein